MATEEGFEQFEDEEAEIAIGGTLPGGRKRLFSKELRCMMYGFGDDQNPYTESVDLLEDLVIEFITEMTHRAMEIGRTGRVQVEDIVFLVRKDPRKYARVKDLLTMNEELKKARKAFDEVKYAEKSDTEKNPSFVRDFKTLADVLIQETIKHDIALEFPELAKVVQGEENNTFTNTLGETIIVEVCSTCSETTLLLARVMEDLGIWIDPIDATGEYVHPAIDDKGLHCVTVLIGAYLKSTGLPVLGIVNKPFCELRTDQLWNGSCYWGYSETDTDKCYSSIIKNSVNDTDETSKTIFIGRSEDEDLKSKLRKAGFILLEIAGAGNKILNVALGMAAAYVLSKNSTYKWDTCAPQAILRSLGGGIVDYQKFLESTNLDDLDLKYSTTIANAANNGGLIAYRNIEMLLTLKQILC
ncbi:inositol polyphosphate 1-phosphatase-like isoform X2 [Vespa velutina]|uniref:inositol polyphosphate 1-phosphatase-like isoform X2 n=1 Tax=Vespa velutina TaxID=202808 RepID=UPI001FB3813B|nr:inositol polyphosphate 1-phosphatase-like isoform X2 [Vespa velutina]